jgi:hypothetical protein
MDGYSGAPQTSAAEGEPIIVHETDRGWHIDYGGSPQDYHLSREEAIEHAMQAARRQRRTLRIDSPRSAVADERDRIADARDRVADARDRVADERERAGEAWSVASRPVTRLVAVPDELGTTSSPQPRKRR